MASNVETDRPITRSDIEAKLREIKGEVDTTTTAAKPYVIAGAAAAAVLVIGIVYALGRRKGRKKTTLVEIRRV